MRAQVRGRHGRQRQSENRKQKLAKRTKSNNNGEYKSCRNGEADTSCYSRKNLAMNGGELRAFKQQEMRLATGEVIAQVHSGR